MATFIGAPGNHVYSSTDSSNTLDYSNEPGPIQVNLRTGQVIKPDGVDTVSNIQTIIGTSYADTMIGDDLPHTFLGGAAPGGNSGNDTLTGGTGNDTFVLNLFAGYPGAPMPHVGSATVTGGGGMDTLTLDTAYATTTVDWDSGTVTLNGTVATHFSGITRLNGDIFNAHLIGPSVAGAAPVYLEAPELAASSSSGAVIDGRGVATTFADFSKYGDAVTIDLAQGTGTFFNTAYQGTYVPAAVTLANVRSIVAPAALYSGKTSTLLGDAYDNTFVLGGYETAKVDGRGGTNTVSYASTKSGLTVDLAAGTADHGGYSLDTVTNIQNVIGSGGTNTLYGTTGDNVLTGGGGYSQMFGRGGNDTFNSGTGYSVVGFDPGVRQTTRSQDADGTLHVVTNTGTDTLHGIQQVNFLDGHLAFNASDPAAAVTRLYTAVLGRDATPAELHASVVQVITSTAYGSAPLDVLAHNLAMGAEFNARYGTLNDPDFVEQIYHNALGRASDAAGEAGWLNLLSHGTDRGTVLLRMIDSPETLADAAGKLAGGIWDLSETAAALARLYDAAFGRLPDAGGLGYWKGQIEKYYYATNLTTVAAAAITSAEFTTHNGTETNAAFVTTIFNTALHRAPSATELSADTAMLNSGTTRAALLVTVSESAEHHTLTDPHILNADPAQFGILFA